MSLYFTTLIDTKLHEIFSIALQTKQNTTANGCLFNSKKHKHYSLYKVNYSLLFARIFTIEARETITHKPHSMTKKLSSILKWI